MSDVLNEPADAPPASTHVFGRASGRSRPKRASVDGDSVLLAVLLGAVFMAAMDVAIVNVAAPSIIKDLGVSGSALELVISGYTITFAALLITGARLGHTYGHRNLFMTGLAGFTAASLLCGLAWSPAVLIAGRAIQGASAAAMTPQVLTLIQLTYAGKARARALAWWATVLSVGAVVGQIAGGALVSANLAGSSWRGVFLVNIPVGVTLLVVSPSVLPRRVPTATRRLDLAGVGLLCALLVEVFVALAFGREAGWAPWVWALLVVSVPTGAGAVWHLRRLARRGGDPVIDLALFHNSSLVLGLLAVCAVMIAYGGFLFTLTLYLQRALGHTPLRSGLTFGPFAVGFAVTSLGVPRLRPTVARTIILAGAAILAGSYAALGVAAWNGDWYLGVHLPLLALAGAGFGAAYSPVIARALSQVQPDRAQDASGVLNTIVQVSFALGVATIGTYYLGAAGSTKRAGEAFGGSAFACGALALLAICVTAALLRMLRSDRQPAAGGEAR